MRLENFLLKHPKFFSNPKVMACSGLIAMLPKLIITVLISGLLTLFAWKLHTIWAFFILTYPIIALVIDLKLHSMKDKIWHTLPPDVPKEWEITSEQLIQYAKFLPKIRLMRFLSCWILIPFINSADGRFLLTISTLAVGFFVAACFDLIWIRVFKLKRPKFPIGLVKGTGRYKYKFCDTAAMAQEILRDNNAMAVGSPAWFAQQHFDSMGDRRYLI